MDLQRAPAQLGRARRLWLDSLRPADRVPSGLRIGYPTDPIAAVAGLVVGRRAYPRGDRMLKRLTMVAVLALAGLLAGCNNPASPSAPAASPPAESPGESPEESLEESPSESAEAS
jgi:hypothetical protein